MSKKYTEYSLKPTSSGKYITDWAFEEGVFLTPQGDYIARVKQGGNYKTLSKHSTIEEAETVRNNFYNKNKPKNK